MSETSERTSPPVSSQPRKPSRPAPPVPVKEQFERSKEILFSNNKQPNWLGGGEKKAARNPVNRRNMRNRKIHSVKRQILIKEKLLEVSQSNKYQGEWAVL